MSRRLAVILVASGAAAGVLALGAGLVRAALDPGGGDARAGVVSIVFNQPPPPPKFDPAAPVACYVDGAFVGRLTLDACGARNGAGTGRLDVGLQVAGDQGGYVIRVALAADREARDAGVLAIDAEVRTPGEATGTCEQHADDDWRTVAGDLTAEDCAIMLFAGLCPDASEIIEGRWNGRPMSLAQGRVRLAGAGGGVRRLTAPGLDCTLPASAPDASG
ncbi:MAG TPA: hypothetical protein VG248_03265 [Caulobacteraceae bacterium]|jgi:hypothetical protein|nr:hypothetical protein [Caulobacteraceae bacterium]